MKALGNYFALARFGYWTKNIAIVPGFIIAYIELNAHIEIKTAIIAIISACFISASNYIMNEYLDRATDKFHPVKKKRVLVHTPLNPHYVILLYLLFLFAGLILAYLLGFWFFLTSIGLLINGIVYNLHPMRAKDVAFVDVIVESFSNPMRFMLGWYAAGATVFAPISILLSYWFFGTYLMCMKRRQELQKFNDMQDATSYRGSYAVYTPAMLLKYAVLMLGLSGIFLAVYVNRIYEILSSFF
jgi:decaprenyl-phosphate phosphoribosyltransferase